MNKLNRFLIQSIQYFFISDGEGIGAGCYQFKDGLLYYLTDSQVKTIPMTSYEEFYHQDSLSVNEDLTSSTDSTRVYFRLSLDSVTTIDCSIYKNMLDINYLYNDGRKRINMNKLRLKDSYKAYKIINKLNTTTLKDVNYKSKTPLMSCFIQPFFYGG